MIVNRLSLESGRFSLYDPLQMKSVGMIRRCWKGNGWMQVLALMIGLATPGMRYAQAHPLAVTTCEVYLEENKLDVRMNILVADLVIFQGLEPKENGRYYDYNETIEAANKHVDFILQYFYIRDKDGNLIPGSLKRLDTSKLTPRQQQGIRPIEVMRYSIDYYFEYTIEGKPEYLNFSQIFGGADNPQPETLELLIHRDGVLVDTPVKIGPRIPHVVRLDWSVPAQSPANDWVTRKREAEKKMLDALGMPQFSGVYSHLYIEDAEVRHELIMPMVILDTLISIPRIDPDFLEVSEQINARKNIEQFFKTGNPVLIDGHPVPATISRIEFFPLDTRDFMATQIPQRVSSYNTRVGIIATYPSPKTPSTVRMQWDGFNRTLPYIKMNVYEFEKDPDYKYLIEEENIFTWARRGSTLKMEGNQLKATFYLPAQIMEASFEKDPKVPGRILSPDTQFASLQWTKRVTSSITSRVNESEQSISMEPPVFFDLDYQELPPGTLSGAIDLSEVIVRTQFALTPPDRQEWQRFELDWSALKSQELKVPVLQRLMYTDRNGEESPVVFRDQETSISWSDSFGVGPGSLFSLPAPESPELIHLPKYPVLAGVAILLTLWTIVQWARHKFRPNAKIWSTSVLASLALAATVTTGTTLSTSPFQTPPTLTSSQKENIFKALHKNIYLAFRQPSESRRYDSLARGVTGELLHTLYLDIQKSLVNQASGGAIARIDNVSVIGTEPGSVNSSGTFDLNATWQVAGTVEHWGHIHTRTNQYQAAFLFKALTNQWKMANFTMLQQEQIGQPYIGLRTAR